jgi:hypothetical protein
MKMISMKREIKLEKDMPATGPMEAGQKDEYDYGLRITLNAESLKKLGITDAVEDYDIDSEVMVMAKCLVKRVEKSKSKDDYGNEKERENESLELQIVAMCLEDGEEKDEEEDIDWDDRRDKVDSRLRKRGF